MTFFKMRSSILLLCIATCYALPSMPTPIKLDEPRNQNDVDPKGVPLNNSARFNPFVSNAYHLFTRVNPTTSQPLTTNPGVLEQSNYLSTRRTVFLIHGWLDSATSDFNSVLVPALLGSEDLNVIVVDWSDGANVIVNEIVALNCVTSGAAVANFINWLNQASGSTLDQYHIIGHGAGAHQAGIVGRNLDGKVSYITGLDPSLNGWRDNPFRFQRNDGIYTEVIHTNGVISYLPDIAQVDIYPNGGSLMPGCVTMGCDHARSFYYFAESITYGGFTAIECRDYHSAVLELCTGDKTIQMGGLTPKTGQTGVYSLATNASPPFSRG